MYGITDLKTGTKFLYNNEPHEVMTYQHSKTGRQGGVMRTRLKNLLTGAIFERTFRGNDKFEPADVSQGKAQYLYSDGQTYNFMDSESYEQFAIPQSVIGDATSFLKEGMECQFIRFDGRAIGIDLPIKVTYEIKETEPGIKGDTAQGGSKAAIIETGAKITVPLFINQGDKIVVDTRDGRYIERA